MVILERVAQANNIPVAQVREEMEWAIDLGWQNPKCQEKWKVLFPDGEKPTPEEVIAVLAQILRRKLEVE